MCRFLFLVVSACSVLLSGATGVAAAQPKDALKPGQDLYGDPLPDGAVARLGSMRLRHAGLSDYVFVDGGKTLLSAGSDRVLRFWDLATGHQARSVKLAGTAGPGRCVTLSPDGKWLVAQEGAHLVFWNVASGKEIKKLPGPRQGWLSYLYFSPDGKTLAVGEGSRVTLWTWQTDAKARQLRLPLKGNIFQNGDSSTHGGFSADGKWVVAGASLLHPLGVFDLASGREVYRLDCNAYTSTVSPDNKRLAVSTYIGEPGKRRSVIRLFELASGKELSQFPLDTDESHFCLTFSPDGNLLACTRSDKSVILDCTTGRVLHRLSGRPWVSAFSPDGKVLLASARNDLRVWDAATGKELHDRAGPGLDPALAVSPDGRHLAEADWLDRKVRLWDTTTGRLHRQLGLKGEERYIRNLAFSGDGQTVAAAHYGGLVQFWDVATGDERRVLQLHDPDHPHRYFYELYVSPDGKQVSTLERIMGQQESTRVAVWDSATKEPLRHHFFPGELRQCAWLADGKEVALPLHDGLTVLDVMSGAVRFRIPDVARSSTVVVSPDDRLLAARLTGKSDTSLGVWEAATGKEVARVAMGPPAHFALAPDNRLLVTIDEGFLRVWDLATGKERRRWPLPVAMTDSWGRTYVYRLGVSADGRRGFTAVADGTILVWDLTPALRPSQPLVKDPGAKEIAAWWDDLASADAGRGYAALWRLTEAPDAAVVSFFRRHVRAAAEADLARARQHIADLNSEKFEVRDKAFKELQNLGHAALPALRQALEKNPPLEVRRRVELLLLRVANLASSPEILRVVRAIQVLEHNASPEARALLVELAGGVAYAPATQHARAALERLSRRVTKP